MGRHSSGSRSGADARGRSSGGRSGGRIHGSYGSLSTNYKKYYDKNKTLNGLEPIKSSHIGKNIISIIFAIFILCFFILILFSERAKIENNDNAIFSLIFIIFIIIVICSSIFSQISEVNFLMEHQFSKEGKKVQIISSRVNRNKNKDRNKKNKKRKQAVKKNKRKKRK